MVRSDRNPRWPVQPDLVDLFLGSFDWLNNAVQLDTTREQTLLQLSLLRLQLAQLHLTPAQFVLLAADVRLLRADLAMQGWYLGNQCRTVSWVMSVAFKKHHSLEKLEFEPKHSFFSRDTAYSVQKSLLMLYSRRLWLFHGIWKNKACVKPNTSVHLVYI